MAIAPDIQQQVYDLLSRSSNLSFVSAESEAPGGLSLSLAPGQRVTAEVLGQAQGNRVPVRIGGQQVTLDLPLQVRPGQNLDLTYIASDPRPTFALYRSGVATQQVSLSDASRLLSLLISNEQFMDPRQRSSLQSISDLLRRTGGESSVMAGFLDDFLTYPATGRPVVPAASGLPEQAAGRTGQQLAGQQGGMPGGAGGGTAPFEDAASRLLLNLAQRSRFTLVEASNQPLHPLPLKPGEEATALVRGTLPDGRTLVQLAGETLELRLPRPVAAGEILRFALVTQQPRPVFALLGQPVHEQPGVVSDTARWLSTMLAQSEGDGEVQRAVMARLQQVISSLPPGSPALAAIMDEAMIYGATPWLSSRSLQGAATTPAKREDEMLRLLQALMQGSRLALLEPELPPTLPRELPFAPGQQLRAEVLQSLGGGRFMIQLADMTLNVLLPKGVRPGDGLNLFFVGNDPPTFLLVRHGRSGDALVSETGRWISTLLGMQNRSTPLEAGLGILRTLLQGAPTDPALLEQALSRGLRESGLFYEAHLARWFSGSYPLESLLREPQGALSPQPQPPQQQPSSAAPSSPQRTVAVQQQGMTAREVTPELLEAALKGKSGSASDIGSDPRTLPIIKEQLATLQTGQLLFQGELFPGQPLEWRVRERADDEASGREERHQREAGWETALSLTLPKLGTVSATIVLEGGRVSTRLAVASPESAALLEEGIGELQEQLTAAGLETGVLKVHHDT